LGININGQRCLERANGYNVEGYRDYRGIDVVGVWLWSKKYNFGIATEIDAKEAFAPYTTTKYTFLATIVSMIAIFSVMLSLQRRIKNKFQMKLFKANHELEEKVNLRTSDLQSAKDELAASNKTLESLINTDALTGISNQRAFEHVLDNNWRRCQREQKSLSLIMLDVDSFKQYNDYYGHTKGDECLKIVVNCLLEANISRRPDDLIARYGGEEFAIQADSALYQSKEKGRNQVSGASVSNAEIHRLPLGG